MAALRSWGNDEVVFSGAGNPDAGGHRDFSVLLVVKNVSGLKAGRYEIRQPKSWETAPRRRGTDGIDEVVLPSPLALTSADKSGTWYWWDIKVAEVGPKQERKTVSSFFTRTTGDGSVPGEFRRLGVSIVRESKREYRLILWGEDPGTAHWLRIGVVSIGHGTQSSLRPIVKSVFLPFAFAIDFGLVPLAFTVFVAGVFLGTRRSVPVTLAVLGAVFLAAYPAARISVAWERADIQRANSPLASMPLDSLRSSAGREFTVTIPGDRQWRRIVRHMGPPSFLVVPATNEEVWKRQTYAAREVGLSLRVARDGSVVALTPTSDTPYWYSSYTTNNGFKFAAEAGDRIAIEARVTGSSLPPNSRLIVVANWGHLNMWDWADGAAMGQGLLMFVASIAAGLGVVLIGGAVLIAPIWWKREDC